MTKREYARYERNVADFMAREGIDCLSSVTDEDTGEPAEAHFSWRPCECCGSHLGGDRFEMEGYNPETKDVQGPYSVCVDCYYYSAYGRLDDMTMLEIEASEE